MELEKLPEPFKKRIDRFNKLFINGTEDHHDFEHDLDYDGTPALFTYEMFCIESALGFAEFLPTKEHFETFLDKCNQEFTHNPPEKYDWESTEDYTRRINKGPNLYNIVQQFCKEYPNNNINEDKHSGNTMHMSWILFKCYLYNPEWIPYMHGALSYLIGDAGYYDDRSDIPEIE